VDDAARYLGLPLLRRLANRDVRLYPWRARGIFSV
jgi:hypothetical protein